MTQTAAFFDFDGTLISGYSATTLMKERILHGAVGLPEALRLVRTGITGQRDVASLMTAGLSSFVGKPMSELTALGERVTRSALGGQLFTEAMDLVTMHQEQGHVVVIASSALPFQVEPLARELGIEHVVCTQLQERDGLITGEFDGDVLWGPAKARAVRSFAEQHEISLADSFGYANGDEDIEFLSSVGHPTAVNPGSELAAKALEDDWPVVRFNAASSGSLIDIPRTLGAYGGFAASCLVGATLGALNNSRRVASNSTLSLGIEVALGIAGVKVNVVGEHHAWSQRPAVFVFNHQSLLDPLVAFKIVQRDATAVGKKELGRTPGLAQVTWLLNAALVDRTDVEQAKKALQPALDRLSEGVSIVLAPEGTRSVTPRVGPFKKGAFHLARQGNVPVVPIVIRNSGRLQWRGSSTIRPGVVDALVLPPVYPAEWREDELTSRVNQLHAEYVAVLKDWDTAVRQSVSNSQTIPAR
jgi:HAD superfamily hydrolase (TIGR01490 family)